MKNTMKYLGILLLFVAMPVCLVSGVLMIVKTYTGGVRFYAYFIFGIGIVLLLLNKTITKAFNNLQIQREYDEFGRRKGREHYSSLSRKERDAIDKQKLADMERILNSTELKKMTRTGSRIPEEDMRNLIGMSAVQKQMDILAARMEFDKKQSRRNRKGNGGFYATEGRHMVFSGPPGTGKTTVARIMCGFLFKYRFIKKNKILEVDGNFLKAGNAADTSVKTELIIREAYGGVLFIDEAYALAFDEQGEAAIATLIKATEDARDKFVLIIAGYDDMIRALLDFNPGFASRFNNYIRFEGYSVDDMCGIFTKMVNDNGLCVTADAVDEFRSVISREMKEKNFGNARNVRRLVDRSISRHAYNIKIGNTRNMYQLSGIDISEI